MRRKSKSRKALLPEWIGKNLNAIIEEYINGKRSLIDNELRQHVTAAFREAHGRQDQDKISLAVDGIVEYIDHRIKNNEATVNCRKRKQAKDEAALEKETAKRLEAEKRAREAEERARKAELRNRELAAQVQDLTRENECLRRVDNDAAELQSLQEDLNEVCGKEVTAELLTIDDVWDRCDEEEKDL